MAGSLNRVELIGNLTKDPEMRTMQSGDKIASLRIATSESWKDKNTGERKEKSEFHSVVIFNEGLARVAEQYLKKGSKVYVAGALQTRKWQDQSGQEKYSTEIVLQKFNGEMILLTPRNSGGGGSSEPGEGSAFDRGSPSRPSGGGSPRNNYGDIDDDIPFIPEFR